MKNLVLLIILTSISLNVTGQKAPVRYVPIDSIFIIPTTQIVKLDFKGKIKNVGRVPASYPWLKNARPADINWTGDTVFLTIDNKKIEFIEQKGAVVDYYLFSAERLESNSYKKLHTLTIPSSIVKEVRKDSILFCLTIELDKKKGNGKWIKVSTQEQDLWIKRNNLDGVLISTVDWE